jgi:hypothetical protein
MSLPFWSIVLAFVLVLGGFVLPWIMQDPRVLSPAFSRQSLHGILNIGQLALTESLAYSVAIGWAIMPKLDYPGSRPSTKHYPWVSNLFFTLVSFATALVAFLLLFSVNRDYPGAKFDAAAYGISILRVGLPAFVLQALQAPAYTLAVSFAIDRYILARRATWRSRVSTGFAFGLSTLVLQCYVYWCFWFIWLPLLGQTHGPPLIVAGLQELFGQNLARAALAIGLNEYAVASACVAFVIGVFVPSTAFDALERHLSVGRGQLPRISSANLASKGDTRSEARVDA